MMRPGEPTWAAVGPPDVNVTMPLKLLGGFAVGLFRLQAARGAEMAFLRQQLLVLKRSAPARLRLRIADRLFPSLLGAAVIFQPETLVRCAAGGGTSPRQEQLRVRHLNPSGPRPAMVMAVTVPCSPSSELGGGASLHVIERAPPRPVHKLPPARRRGDQKNAPTFDARVFRPQDVTVMRLDCRCAHGAPTPRGGGWTATAMRRAWGARLRARWLWPTPKRPGREPAS
jgi:hypothetical protein